MCHKFYPVSTTFNVCVSYKYTLYCMYSYSCGPQMLCQTPTIANVQVSRTFQCSASNFAGTIKGQQTVEFPGELRHCMYVYVTSTFMSSSMYMYYIRMHNLPANVCG